MQNISLTADLKLSRIVHGLWRLNDWNMNPNKLLSFIKQVTELGITSFDHADIYGGYTCEKLFGDAVKKDNSLRENMQLITKCGIKLLSPKYPERTVKHYDYSYKHIMESVHNSLKNLNTGYIDLLLLHRPAPFFDPAEVAKAFFDLQNSGKVLNFGVSNFTPQQFEMLQSYIDQPLATNQVEISPLCLEHFENGNIDFFLQKRVKPMAWSPLAGGRLLNPETEKEKRLHVELFTIATELGVDNIDKVIFSWILKHPTQIIPITGSGNISRIKRTVEALSIAMTMEQWYRIYIASTGEELP